MSSLSYKFRCLKKINSKKINIILENISKKTNKSKSSILMDIVYCSNKYGAGYHDYQEFEFYNLTNSERKTYLTRVKNNQIVKKYNNKEYIKYFDNKCEFNKKFEKFLKRDWMYLNDLNKFKEFCKSKKNIVVKPIDGCGGIGVEVINLKNKDLEELYYDLITNKQLIVEEKIIQNKLLAKLNESSVNTLRIVSFLDDNNNVQILNSVLKIGNGGVTDNFSSGSMYTFISDEGKIIVPAIDTKDNIFDEHPLSKIKLVGYQIPNYDLAIDLVKECCKKIKEVRYIGWDVAILDNDASIIEGNCYPGIYQIKPSFVKDKIGLIPKYEEKMKIKIDKL